MRPSMREMEDNTPHPVSELTGLLHVDHWNGPVIDQHNIIGFDVHVDNTNPVQD